jgi:hypothetical protein
VTEKEELFSAAELEAAKRAKYLENARKWMAGNEGKRAFTKEILENLLVNVQIEKEEGQEIREDKMGPMHARQCRKQLKETAEFILEIIDGLKDAT